MKIQERHLDLSTGVAYYANFFKVETHLIMRDADWLEIQQTIESMVDEMRLKKKKNETN